MDCAFGGKGNFWGFGGNQLARGSRSEPNSSSGGGFAGGAVYSSGHDAGHLYAGSFCAARMNSSSTPVLIPHSSASEAMRTYIGIGWRLLGFMSQRGEKPAWAKNEC